jgi:acetyl-CoA C-acetyltransferase
MHLILKKDIVVVGAARTPIGARDGILKNYSATDLGGIAIKAALERSRVPPAAVSEVILGNVVGAGLGMALAKKASVAGGLPQSTPATVVNSVCSSGMTAVWNAVQAIELGVDDVVVAGGMESRTNAPYLLNSHTPDGKRLKGQLEGAKLTLRAKGDDLQAYTDLVRQLHEAGILDANILDGLTCPFNAGLLQNDYAIAWAKKHGLAIPSIDEAAYDSYRKAEEASESGKFDDEIAPAGDAKRDELVPRSRWEGLKGTSTAESSAYNTGGLGDCGAALVIAAAARARELGAKPIARITGMARFECPPEQFVEAPVHAVEELTKALKAAGKSTDFPIIEANESFGLQILLFKKTWPNAAINVHGGTVALRHPLGAAGARILTTLVYAMRRYHHPRGLAVICFGGGGAFATALELVGE